MKHHFVVTLRVQNGHLPVNYLFVLIFTQRDNFYHFSCRCIEDISLSILYVLHREKVGKKTKNEVPSPTI